MRSYYQGLRQRGKPGKAALVAVIRKPLLQLITVARRGTPWVPMAAYYNRLYYPMKGLKTNTDIVQLTGSISMFRQAGPEESTLRLCQESAIRHRRWSVFKKGFS